MLGRVVAPLVIACGVLPSSAQDYDAWARVTRSHISEGELEGVKTHVIDYAAIAKDDDFHGFVKSLEVANTQNLTRNETYALFMNAYNALAMKKIIDHPCKKDIVGKCEGPISSILEAGLDIYGPASSVWLQPAGNISGKIYSLQQIEDFLRAPKPFAEDSRLHACIVCASISCPDVRMEAFVPVSVDAQMKAQMVSFLANPTKGMKLEREAMTVTLSSIFKWYAADFAAASGSVLDFVAQYAVDGSIAEFIKSNKDKLSVRYFQYDWHVNGAPPCDCESGSSGAMQPAPSDFHKALLV
eukprot:TRINITY_DN37211_c0_g1_i1.p1 TRINITY_DN37211_c0_g1~~TRINITY_DN37211_c0_g1_i1.p1  ORF type:complete len:299 (-),score=73.51 TRINITY_DN37211_c0_g1_i1:321-1217(-)